MTWGYRHRGVEKEFETEEELVRWLTGMDPGIIRGIRLWQVENTFEFDDLVRDVADGKWCGITTENILDDGLYNIKEAFRSGDYDWTEDTIEGIYYRE